ncbi:phosphatase 2C-like domain-containing protein [Cubamyces lactineus]|nr:phosphatase 2C-like domain-containing protein [Cubamyces lactineus]
MDARAPSLTRTLLSANAPTRCTSRQVLVDLALCHNEKTIIPPLDSGVSRYDVVHLSSNEPIEDTHAEAILPVPSGYWSFFGIFDGHSGWETSTWLADNLITAVVGALGDLYSSLTDATKLSEDTTPQPTPLDVEKTLKDTFARLDNDIVHDRLETVFSSKSKYAAVNLLAPAYAGSCALLSFYDCNSGLLHTALTGDSRAVLGRQIHDASGRPTGMYSVHVLTTDQTGHNPSERQRIESDHPDEQRIRNGRVLGMGISRAFGDARFKWSREVQDRLKREYLGRTPLAAVKTPPYLTAEPEVTSFAVRPGDFLVLASDGLWECLTNEEAVGLVGLWKEARSKRSRGAGTNGGAPLTLPEIPVERQEEDQTVRYRQWGTEKRFVSVDENAATHLLRNALGGADTDLTAALLGMKAPRSRTYRDDITITVVFFSGDDRRIRP